MDTETVPERWALGRTTEGEDLGGLLYPQRVLDSLPEGLLVLDSRGHVQQVNPALERLLGRPGVHLLGRPFREAVPLRCVREDCGMERLLRGETVPCEAPAMLSLERKEEIPLLVSCAALPAVAGHAGGVVVLLRDVRHWAEAERLREDLIHMLIHDLKGPLASISSTIQILRQYPAEQVRAETAGTLLDIAEKNAWRLARLVDTILDVQRLEAGRSSFRVEAVGVAEAAADVLRMAEPLAMESQVEMEADFPPDLPPVMADSEVLRRILWNLLDNALKYTPAGGSIRVSARYRGKDAQGEWVEVRVSDTGPGIPPEDQARIFDKYAQVRMAPARRRGVGLGLTFCRLAVEAMGGRIWVESAQGMGSTFSFVLPVALPPEGA